jgi:hypothetical protein
MSKKRPTPAGGDEPLAAAGGEELGQEASRYLEVVETFAALEADPHGDVRTRAARKREAEGQAAGPRAVAERRAIRRWRS